ncbi:MAG: chemotaxis protein CheC [Cellulosilyticaceae bacterium]
MGKYKALKEQLDALTEAGNIGAGNAATALSMLLKKPVDMTIAKVNIKAISELGSVLGSEENYIAAMLIEVYGDIKAMLILAFELESAHQLVDMVLENTDTKRQEFDALDYSVLCETGNILAGSYLNALATLTQLELTHSVPQMALDMAIAILSYPAVAFSTEDNAMMFIETKFTDNEKILNGTYILVVDETAIQTIVNALERLV